MLSDWRCVVDGERGPVPRRPPPCIDGDRGPLPRRPALRPFSHESVLPASVVVGYPPHIVSSCADISITTNDKR